MYGNQAGRARGGSPREWVGVSLFHTVADRDRLVEQIDDAFGRLASELFSKMGGDSDLLKISEMYKDPGGWARRYQVAQQTIQRSPIYPVWHYAVMPLWNEWKRFYTEQSSWEEWKTNWGVYEGWRDRVAKLLADVSAEVSRLTGQRIWTSAPSVGISLFHTVGDRDRLVEQTMTEFTQLLLALKRKMGVPELDTSIALNVRDPQQWQKNYEIEQATMKKSPLYPLWHDAVSPLYSEFKRFYDDQSSWEEFKTSWETYEHWHDRVAALRDHVANEVARIMPGDPIRTPTPSDVPTTIWADIEHKGETVVKKGAGAAGEAARGIGDVLKYSIYAVLAIGGIVAISSVAANLKKGEDPMGKWMQYAKRGAR
jgi:hypothetical protein